MREGKRRRGGIGRDLDSKVTVSYPNFVISEFALLSERLDYHSSSY